MPVKGKSPWGVRVSDESLLLGKRENCLLRDDGDRAK